jgi:RHS repeat-associated protein
MSGAVLKQFLYGYDPAGNRTSEQIDLGVTGANYNNVNQLTTTIGGGPVRFVGHLDEPGTVLIGTNAATMGLQSTSFVGFAQTTLGTNVVTITATDYSSNSRTNRYQVVITNNSVARTLTYDLNGNETSVITATATNTYEWDAADRLVAINNGPNRSEFTYDGLGRRTKILEKFNGVAQNTNLFLWCGTELCEQRDSTGGTVSKRFFGRGEQISGTSYFFTRDHLGSIREMTDGIGAIRARYEYDPYGRRTKVQGDLDSDFAFTGHYVHAPSGLYLALYRAYDADTARWLDRDPIRELGGINPYAYVRNDPIRLVDPRGLRIIIIPGSKDSAVDTLLNGLDRLGQTSTGRQLRNKAVDQDVLLGLNDNDPHALPQEGGGQGEAPLPAIMINPRDPSGIGCDYREKYPSEVPPDSPEDPLAPLALVLGHELGHALNDADDPENIVNAEWPLARELGLHFQRQTQNGEPLFDKNGNLNSN